MKPKDLEYYKKLAIQICRLSYESHKLSDMLQARVAKKCLE